MATIYHFPVDAQPARASYPLLIRSHVEQLLLLGHFGLGAGELHPTHIQIGSDRCELFSTPADHLWREGSDTSKAELSRVRRRGDVDRDYDIDVLRMSEPRILFIRDTLARINALPTAARERVLDHRDGGERSPDLSASFARHLGSLCSGITLLHGERRVDPEWYEFLRYPARTGARLIVPHGSLEPFASFLEAFGHFFQLDLAGDLITSFTLASYEPWLEPSDGDPFEVLGTLSRDCNAKCDFCYVIGNPATSAVKLPSFTRRGSAAEARTRLRFFQQGLRLPIPTYDTEEVAIHADFIDVCKGIRQTSSHCISITTNGYWLTEPRIRDLDAIAPVDISLSLNAVTPDVRAWLMGGRAERGLTALALLHQHRVPCAVTIAAWPRVPISEVVATIRHADAFSPRSISLLLGGYTKYFPDPPDYPIPEYWNKVIDEVVALRSEITTPLLVQPRMYEKLYRFPDKLLASLVVGVNRGSSAAVAGIGTYDEIVAIEGLAVVTPNQCLSLLSTACDSQATVRLELRRDGKSMTLVVDPGAAEHDYRYGGSVNDRYGIHLMGEGIRVSAIRDIYEKVNALQARRVLFLTSMIVRPYLAEMLPKLAILCDVPDVEFDLQVVPSVYLGGNIVMGDMLVVDDFWSFIDEYLSTNDMPDLVVIPSGPFNHGGWLRDMKGQSFEILRRAFAVPIHLVRAPYFE